MNVDEYQSETGKTAVYNQRHSILYLGLALGGETGEVQEKIKKVIRDKEGKFDTSDVDALKYELGDVMWYISELATGLGLKLSDVLSANLEKLESRLERNKLHGAGDSR